MYRHYLIIEVLENQEFQLKMCIRDRLVPGYYFRKNPDGSLSNGSWCGNDVDSQKKMVRKYIVDMSKRWQQFYGFDAVSYTHLDVYKRQTCW